MHSSTGRREGGCEGGREGGLSVELLSINIPSFVYCLLIVYVELLFLGFFLVILIDYNKNCLQRVFFFNIRNTKLVFYFMKYHLSHGVCHTLVE